MKEMIIFCYILKILEASRLKPSSLQMSQVAQHGLCKAVG